jgi:hypothetical protein
MRSPFCLCVCVSPPIVVIAGKYVPVAVNTIEELLNAVFSMKSVSYKKICNERKVTVSVV